MNRCKFCFCVCPDFSDICDSCNYIEQETKEEDRDFEDFDLDDYEEDNYA